MCCLSCWCSLSTSCDKVTSARRCKVVLRMNCEVRMIILIGKEGCNASSGTRSHNLASARTRDFVHRRRQATPTTQQHIADAQHRYQTSTDSPTTTSSGIQDWKPSLCQGSILLYNTTFEEAIQ